MTPTGMFRNYGDHLVDDAKTGERTIGLIAVFMIVLSLVGFAVILTQY
jgi:hypothetical protein